MGLLRRYFGGPASLRLDPRSRDSNIRRSWLHSRQGHHVPVEPCLELAWKCMLHPANLATGEVFAAVATLATSGLCLGETSSTNLILFLVFSQAKGLPRFMHLIGQRSPDMHRP